MKGSFQHFGLGTDSLAMVVGGCMFVLFKKGFHSQLVTMTLTIHAWVALLTIAGRHPLARHMQRRRSFNHAALKYIATHLTALELDPTPPSIHRITATDRLGLPCCSTSAAAPSFISVVLLLC